MQLPTQPRTPGSVLAHDFLAPMGIDAAHLAAEAGLPRWLLADVVAGTARIDDEIAACLGDFLGTGSQFWLGLQHSFDRASMAAS